MNLIKMLVLANILDPAVSLEDILGARRAFRCCCPGLTAGATRAVNRFLIPT